MCLIISQINFKDSKIQILGLDLLEIYFLWQNGREGQNFPVFDVIRKRSLVSKIRSKMAKPFFKLISFKRHDPFIFFSIH